MFSGLQRSLASQLAQPLATRSAASQSRPTRHRVASRTASSQQPAPEPPKGDGGSSGSELPLVHIEYRGRRLQAPRGSTLRTALLEAGVTPHNGRAALINCRGLGTCGTCAVEVHGEVDPRGWTPQERLRLNFLPHAPPGNLRLRLACQVACEGDLRVTKRSMFWGQGDDVLPDLAAEGEQAAEVQPLGQLEFVLDRRRRRQ